ncbi:DUF3231 family protein [Priestia aryabhattai]|uniref:DUF3231 family protein n=1 Tax=Priestia aryabhattai TaxID=412384 RepID=UPI001ADAD3A6|nr:DUF3231 family protein [Priestia aryabhattai]QTL51266.1 DUF3231 family protein [Priestia aryabhattai]
MAKDDMRLTSSEITSLWVQYIQETMAICISKYVLATVKDNEVRSLFKFCLELSEKHLKTLKKLLNDESFPLPNGFTEKDVNLKAPPLFTDFFWLEYIHDMTTHGLSGYSTSYRRSIRKDIRNYYYQCNMDAMDVYNRSIDILLSKGLYERDPYFSTPQKTEFITDIAYAMNIFGKKRPLNSMEVGNIYSNLRKSILVKAILLGFQQVTQDKKVHKFMNDGLNICAKHIDIFSSILHEENLHSPRLLDTQVTTSTISPFSDKLMLFHIGFMFNLAMVYYATAMAESMRIDIIGHCEASMLRDLKIATTWGNIMIEKGWIEKPPEANDRKELPNN